MKKHILCDIDDVILNYSMGFLAFHNYETPKGENRYIHLKEYVNEPWDIIDTMVQDFNTHEEFSNLEPFKQSFHYLNKLKEDGYGITLISKCGADKRIEELRHDNLRTHFGNYFFNDIFLIENHDSKYDHLRQFENSGYIWLEDNIENYYIGESLGLKSLLLKTQFNNHDDDFISEVDHWNQVYYVVKNWYE